MFPVSNTRGFSLIELTLVLFILALAAQLGVRELSRVRGDVRAHAAGRQLDDLAAAVYDDADGEPRGFLCDMGRLPLASPLPGLAATNALVELYDCPAGVGDFRSRPASAANLAPDAPAEIADPSVLVPCGWGGPYVSIPHGDSHLRDPWGNPFENPDSAGLTRLLDSDGSPAAAGAPIAAIRHFGSDGMEDTSPPPADERKRDATRAFEKRRSGVLLTFAADTVAKVHWYAPLGDKITGGAATPDPGMSQLRIGDMTPGIRFLKVAFTNGTARVLQIALRPGRDAAVAL